MIHNFSLRGMGQVPTNSLIDMSIQRDDTSLNGNPYDSRQSESAGQNFTRQNISDHRVPVNAGGGEDADPKSVSYGADGV